jgi:polyhydroxyalkanoate synthase
VTLHACGADGPALLLIPAPIKRAYLWDLAPQCSVVRQALEAGCRVYLLEWQAQQGGALGLDDYADRLILACIDAIEAETGLRRVFVAGHSLGGTLAAIFAARRPERVRGLILLGAPLHFAPNLGALGPLAASVPDVAQLADGDVPGSFLNAISLWASPETFIWSRWGDWLASVGDPRAIDTYLRVERWTHDEMPIPHQLFVDVVQQLCREDRFMRGSLQVCGQAVGPDRLTMPVLGVVDARCALVPPAAVVPFLGAVRSPDTLLLPYEGDTGVMLQHVGMLVGRSAHRHLWPQILHWLRSRA